jgi:putative oxidoreductase
MKLLHLNFLPASADLGLLVLRLGFGGAMLFLHGWGKLVNYSDLLAKFGDPIGLGKTPSLILVIFAEVVCAAAIAVGAFTRLSALILGFTMGVAFFIAHGGKLSGSGSGEMAFLFLVACVTLVIAGGGKFSVDAKVGAKA